MWSPAVIRDPPSGWVKADTESCLAVCSRTEFVRWVLFLPVYEQLNKNSRNLRTDKSYPQPEHISSLRCKPEHQKAQQSHYSREQGFQ